MTAGLRSGRAAWAAAALAVLVFGALLLLLPAFAIGFDEAKYLGIGANIWAGNGPLTAFGGLFLLHSPVWMTSLFAPQAIAGVDAVSWGHAMDGIAGMAVIGLTAVIGGWSRPSAGVVAAFAMLAFTYLLDLTRTTRLDVPAAALALLYLVVGWRAVRSGSARWAAGAGLVFALAVLVKEVAIPLAPVPFLCGVLADVPWRRIFRTAAWTALLASLGLAPWFLYYAAETGRVYRVESPAWTLPVLFVPLAALIVLGLFAEALAVRPRVTAATSRLAARAPAALVTHARSVAGWGLAFAWSGLFLFFFSRIARLKGAPLFELPQYGLYARQWAIELAPMAVFVGIGLVLALALLLSDRETRERRGVVNALVATVCGAPLVLMVVAVGEPPRNYIAQVATAAAVAAGSWIWAFDRLLGHLARTRQRPGLARWGIPVVVGVAMVIGIGAVGARAWVTRAGSGEVSGAAIRTTVDWIRANVPEGTPLAFGSFLSYEMAYELVPDYPTHQVRHRISTVDPSLPMGFKRAGEPPADDWVAADTAPRNVNEYQAYRASWVENALRKWNIGYWIYTTGIETSAPAIRRQLTPEHGFETVASWDFGSGNRVFNTTIYRVDLGRVALDRSKLYISAEALDRLVTRLELEPDAPRELAARLLGRIVVEPPTSDADGALARLRALAQP